ncbi:hypothetical protein I4U23_022722 [Adineta vaga]|nr:hypothetical protein I4U23_022722 [Adineta vaga]
MHKAVVYVCIFLLIAIYTNASPTNPAINEIQRIDGAAARNADLSDQNMIMLNNDQSGNQSRSMAEFNLIAPRVNPSERSLVNEIALLTATSQPSNVTA